MKELSFIILFILFFARLFHPSEQENPNDFEMTIKGQVVNKLGETSQSTKGVLVEYIRNDEVRGQTLTNASSAFTINGIVTGIEDIALTENNFEMKGPNPYDYQTRFEVTVAEPGRIIASNIKGQIKETIELPNPGIYEFSYDGMNTTGTDLITVQTNSWQESQKLINTGRTGSKGLEIESIQGLNLEYNLKSATETETDSLKISGNNISTTYAKLWHQRNDLNVGQKYVNQGPEITTEPEIWNIEKGTSLSINLDDYIYNDDQSTYTSQNNDFKIEDGKVTFSGSSTGTYNTIIDVTDSEDENLTTELEFKVNVTVAEEADLQAPEFNLPDTIQGIEDETLYLNLDESATDNKTSPENIIWDLNNGNFTTTTLEGRIASFKPGANENGIDKINASITDEAGNQTSKELIINYEPVPDAPIANNDTVSTQYETVKTINALANDTDPDFDIDPSKTAITTNPTNGIVTNNEDGSFDYTPNNGFEGEDNFEYEIVDETNLRDTARVNITVSTNPNNPPEFNQLPDDSTNEDIPKTGVGLDDYVSDDFTSKKNIEYDIEISNQNLLELTINENRELEYNPKPDEFGSTQITITARDEEGFENSSTYNFTVNPVDDNPIANDDYKTTPHNTSIDILVAENDTDVDGDLDPASAYATSNPSKGTITKNQDGSFTYNPNQDATGEDSFTYKIKDENENESNNANVYITIEDAQNPSINLPDHEIIQGEHTEIDADDYMSDVQDADQDLSLEQIGTSQTTVSINQTTHTIKYEVSSQQTGTDNVILQVTDTDGNTAKDTVYISAITNNPPNANDYTINMTEDQVKIGPAFEVTDDHTSLSNLEAVVSGFNDVNVSINQNTKVPSITPNENINGTRTGTVTFTDEQGKSNDINMTLNIASVNDLPQIGDINNVSLDEDSQYTGPSISLTDVEDPIQDIALTATSNNQNLQVSINNENKPTYNAINDWNGNTTVKYTATDTDGGIAEKTINVTVNPVDDAPRLEESIANQTNPEDQTLNIDLTGKFYEPDGEEINYTIKNLPAGWSQNWNNETVNISAPENYNGTITGLKIEASDPQNNKTESNNFSITKTPINDPVEFSGSIDNIILDNGESTNIDLKNYFSDVETSAENLNYNLSGLSLGNYTVNNGILTITATTQGSETDLRASASDEGTTAESNYFGLTVNKLNETPTANDDAASTAYETAKNNINVATNDTDPDNNLDLTSVVIQSGPNNGNANVDANGYIDYTPNNNFSGEDNITYTIKDTEGLESNIANLTITVEEKPNEAPTANDDAASTAYETSKTIDVLANDTDEDGSLDASSVSIYQEPVNGSVSVNETTGAITYNPDNGFSGNDNFKYTVKDDDNATSNAATVTVTVGEAPNVKPTANDDNVSADEDVPTTFDVLANDSDSDGSLDASSVNVISSPAHGTTSVNTTSGAITYTTGADQTSDVSFQYEVADNDGAKDTATVNVNVNPVNDPVEFVGTIEDIVLENGESIEIDLKNFFIDKETASEDLQYYTLNGLSLGTYSVSNGVLTITATTLGTESDLKAYASDESTTAESNYFSLTVIDRQKVQVTFDFREVGLGEKISSGTATIYYRLLGHNEWTQDSIKTSDTGYIHLNLIEGRTYEVEFDHTQEPKEATYTAFALIRDGDVEAFDQQDAHDKHQEITVQEGGDYIYVHIFLDIYLMGEWYTHAGYDGSKKVHPDNEMHLWWNANYEPSNATQRGWIQDIQDQVAQIPYVTINLPFTESTTAPSGVYLEVKYNNSLGNSTVIDANNYITRAGAGYDTSSPPGERTFKLEVYQAMNDWQDQGGDPPFMDASGNINTTGKKVMAVSYLFRAGTEF